MREKELTLAKTFSLALSPKHQITAINAAQPNVVKCSNSEFP